MKKRLRNVEVVIRKLGPALTRATNHRLEVTREERRKTKAIAIKCRIARGRISSSGEEEGNYKCNTGDETDPD